MKFTRWQTKNRGNLNTFTYMDSSALREIF